MKPLIFADGGSADLGSLFVHDLGCACADCAIYDDNKQAPPAPVEPRGFESFGPAWPAVGTLGLFFDRIPVRLGENESVGTSLGLGDFAPPTDVVFVDVPGDTSSMVALGIGSARNDQLEVVGDRDWFRVTLTAGQTYTFTIGSAGTGSITDSFLRLHNSLGTQLAFNDDAAPGNLYSRLVFTATTSGTYFVNVGSYNDLEAGAYRVSAAVDVADSIPGNSTTTASLTVGGAAVNNVLDVVGDHDWFRVDLVAGQSYFFRTSATGGANDPDTYLRLYGPNGTTLLAQNDDGGGGTYSQIRFTATTSGTYYLDVGAFEDSEAGNYRVAATIAPPLQVFTNDQIADQLINGYWGGAANARHFNVAPGGTITFNVTALTAAGQTLAREAFNLWSDATGITFSEIAGTANITLDDAEDGAFASSTRTGNIITSSRVNVGLDWLSAYGTGLNTYSFQTYLHEIGHAIGLGHAGPYNGSATYGQDNSYLNDAWATTVMSYFDQQENTYFNGQGFSRQFVLSPIVADVIATSLMYGTPNTTRIGNTTYGYNNTSGRAIYDATQFPGVTVTIVDHGGTDTLDYSGNGQTQTINLNAESFSSVGGRNGNLTIARGTIIENAIGGSGNDTLIGNAADNLLRGGAGLNWLMGNGGNDTLEITAAGQQSTFDGGSGFDTLLVTGAVTLTGTITAMEALSLTPGAALTLAGLQFNTLPFNAVISGSGTITVNMQVGTGLDYAEFSATLFNVSAAAGTQFVVNGTGGLNIMKAADVATTLNGGAGIDQMRGGSVADILIGGGGNDKIWGLDGADTLTGGAGADQFRYVLLSESGPGAGADRILDFVSGTDVFNFAILDADPVAAGRQALNYIGTQAFVANGTAQVRHATFGADQRVQADFNGDGVVDMEIVLVGLGGQPPLNAGDFML